MLLGGTVLAIAVIQQARKRSPQSSQQLLLLSIKLEDIARRVSTSPIHRAREGPCLSPIMVEESSGVGAVQGIDEPDYVPQQDATATAIVVTKRSTEVS